MNKFTIPLAAAALVLGSTASWASWVITPSVTGVGDRIATGGIIAIDDARGQLLLDDRKTYTLEPGVDLSDIRVGDKVSMLTEDQEGDHMIMAVTKLGRGLNG